MISPILRVDRFVSVSMLLCVVSAARAATPYWYIDDASLYRIDLDLQSVTPVGPLLASPLVAEYGGLAYDPTSRELLALLSDGTVSTSSLYRINRLTGEATHILDVTAATDDEWFSGFDISPSGDAVARTHSRPSGEEASYYGIDLQTGEAVKRGSIAGYGVQGFTDLAFDLDDRLWDLGKDSNTTVKVYERNIETGAPTLVADTGMTSGGVSDVSMGFNPDDGHLYWLVDDGEFYRVSPATGETFRVEFGVPGDETVGTFAPVPEPSGMIVMIIAAFALAKMRPQTQ